MTERPAGMVDVHDQSESLPSSRGHGGLFVVLEGGEGVGKTTQWRLLADTLRAVGHDVVAVREPGGTQAGDVIRSLLLDPSSSLTDEAEALLFAASRAQLLRTVVAPALARGAIVLVDRFLLSTYAYQGAGRGLPVGVLRSVNALATGGITPHLTLLLTLPFEVAQSRAAARGAADRMEQEDIAFHMRVHEAFQQALEPAWQQQHPEIGEVVAIGADTAVDAVTARCLDVLVRRWPARFADAATRRMATAPGTQ